MGNITVITHQSLKGNLTLWNRSLTWKRPRVFLSYRRQDSQSITDRIYDSLVSKLGKKNVFKDVDSIAGGANIKNVIHDSINRVSFLVVVIGPNWEGKTSIDDKQRIDSDDDWVRLEVQSAFDKNIPVIPVLVNKRTTLPQELPLDLIPLLELNALRARDDPDFKRDIKRLLHTLGYRWWHERRKTFTSFIVLFMFSFSVWFATIGQIYQWDRVMVANFSTDQWDAAEVIADKIISKDPTHLRALSVKGSVAALSGQYRTAIKFFQKAYDLAPENRPIRRNLAYAMLQSGRTDTAVELYEGLRNGTGAAEYSVACAYLGAGRYQDAISVVRALPDSLLSPQEGSPEGQVSILEAASLMGRGLDGDKELAIRKARFAISQNSDYWRPILRKEEKDPQNEYQIQIQLLEPILAEIL